jgi:hypothetical protein
LLLFNGEVTNRAAKVRKGRGPAAGGGDDGTLAKILAASPDVPTRLNELFLAVYGRFPTPDERMRYGEHLAAAPTARARYEDLFFALLTSTEMITNH